MRYLPILCLTALAATLAGIPATADGPGPGDLAPGFSLQGSDGQRHALADYRERKVVVLAWFPKAFTGG
jgi:peroxiredoxin Q/BCP